MSKSTLKNRLFSKQLKIKQNTVKIEVDVLWFQVEVNFFQSEKTSVQVSAVPKLCPFKIPVNLDGEVSRNKKEIYPPLPSKSFRNIS